MERIAPLKSFHAAESTAYVEFLSVKGAQAALEMAAAHGGTIEISSSVRVILTQPTTKHLGAGSIPTQPSVSHQEWFASVLSAPVAPISDNSNDRVDTTTEVSKKMSTATICVPPTRRSKEVSDPASRPQHVCMLCLRKFPSRENLERHEQRSLMHKQALAKRSGRRRRPVTEAIVPSKLADPSPPELAPLPASSKGSQLLSKLGWVAGSGAGVRAQGITAPLSASGMGGRTASTRHGLGAVDARKPS
ncbi:RNA-binding protein 5 [Hondaea fermentalgiana]|uniref:RNA-binding protein 5 n=1 Tax=Hondaea fermentalgiana TaxID=2315210 RepID=A0A2R5GBD6_9STRA|nr:RNA-binding protein 5 [Hondaea fermentalgiana]|eukprot:GBG28290.1 RNA-binding protein 5 [Hondaea fermentalgiana]